MRANEVAAAIHADMCDDDRNGYSWSPRQGADHPDGVKTITLDGRDYSYPLGSWDCSSSAIKAWELALGRSLGCSTTYDMRSAFLATRLFEWRPMSFTADVGDLYLSEQSHVAMCQSQVPDMLSEFCIDENGGVYGGQVGDQTGWEAYVHGYYDFPWDGILHYVGGDAAGGTPPSAPAPAPAQGAPSGAEWQGDMLGLADTTGSGDDYAGVPGRPIVDVAIEGVGAYQVSDVRHRGFWPAVDHYDLSDPEGGYAGDGQPVDRLRIPDPTVHYQLHVLGGGWHDPMVGAQDTGGSADDFAGEPGVQHDLLRVWRVTGEQPRYNVRS